MKSVKMIFAKKWVLLVIILLALFFRFYKLQSWFMFGMDQEYEAFLAQNIITGHHLPLIGVNASNTGIYLGPAFIYFVTLVQVLFKQNLLGWAIVASLLGVCVTFLTYIVSRELFDYHVGIFSSFIYSSSFLVSFYDRQFWNPMFIPLFSLLIGYLLYQIYLGRPKKLMYLSLIFGLAIQCHLSFLIFVPLIVFVLYFNRRIFTHKIVVWSIIIFVLLQSPVILFEFRHNFTNTHAIIQLFQTDNVNKSNQSSTLSNRLSLYISMLSRYVWVPNSPDLFVESGQCNELLSYQKKLSLFGCIVIILMLSLAAVIYFNRSKSLRGRELNLKINKAHVIHVFILLSSLFFVIFYSRQIIEYYFMFLFPWIAILFGLICSQVYHRRNGKKVIFCFLLSFLSLNLITTFSSSYSYSYSDKLSSINFARSYVFERNYVLEALGECPRFGGYRYLFEHFISPPSHSYMDSYFSWLYPKSNPTANRNTLVLLSLIDNRMNDDTRKKWYALKIQYLNSYRVINSGIFGKIQVYILSPR